MVTQRGSRQHINLFLCFLCPGPHSVVGFILCIDKPNKTEKNIQIFIIPYFYMLLMLLLQENLK